MILEELTVNNRSVSVVVPVYNNGESLSDLNAATMQALSELPNIECEIIYVDDGSMDNSLSVLKEIQRNNSMTTKIVKLAGNFGQVNAVLAGVQVATKELISTISADLQDPPEIITRMHRILGSSGRIAIAERESRNDSFFMSIASRITYGIMRIQNKNIPKRGFDCWMLDSKIALYILNKSRISSLRQMNFFESGNQVYRISYVRLDRKHGKSGYKISKKIQMFVEIITMSLGKLASYLILLGLSIALLSLVLFALVLYSYSNNRTPFQGFTFLVGLTTMFGSFTLIAIGTVLFLILRQGEVNSNQLGYIIDQVY